MKHLLAFLLLLCSASVSAQDVIVKKDGSTIVCRVVELNATEITYKKWSDLNGSNYVMDRSLASAINYENGKKVNLSEVDNQYRPGNQNDGNQRMNDRALLALEYTSNHHNPYKKAKALRTIGWIGGATLVTTGIVVGVIGGDDYVGFPIFLCPIGAAWTATFLAIGNHYKKQADRYQFSSLYYQNIKFSNTSSLSIGTEMIKDKLLGNNTIGLGLHYSF